VNEIFYIVEENYPRNYFCSKASYRRKKKNSPINLRRKSVALYSASPVENYSMAIIKISQEGKNPIVYSTDIIIIIKFKKCD